MLLYFDWLLNQFNKYRQSIGLSFFFFFGGLPIIYFLRDGLKLAPNSTAFTAALALISLFMAFPLNPKKLYQANTLAYGMCLAYASMALIYLGIYTPNRGWFTNTPIEVANQVIVLLAMFIFAGVSINSLQKYFLKFTLVICVLGAFSLLYYIARNPLYIVGIRAAISFGDDDGGMASMGSPHIYAKSAYIGLVAGFIVLKSETRLLWRLGIIGCILILLLVIGLCQAMAMVLITGVFLFLYFISNIKANTIYKTLKWIFGWQGIVAFGIIFYLFSRYFYTTEFNDYVIHTYDLIYDRLEKIVMSFFGNSSTKVTTFTSIGDDSASTRVNNITYVFDVLNENWKSGNVIKVLFGNGYQQFYVDSPFIEMLHDLGVVGFVIFSVFHIVVLRWIWKEIFNPTCDFTLMVAYFFLATFIQNFTMGMPYDYGRWCAMAFIARFALNYKKVPILKTQISQTIPS